MVMKPKHNFKTQTYVVDGDDSVEEINLIFFHCHHIQKYKNTQKKCYTF